MNDLIHDLAAVYSLGSLDDLERRQFERHLPECSSCQREVAEHRETLVTMAWRDAEAPPAHLRGKVLAELARTPQVGTLEEPGTAAVIVPPRLVRRWLPATVAAALVAVALIGWSMFSPARLVQRILDDPAAVTTGALATDAGTGVFTDARVVFSAAHRSGVFVVEGLRQVGADRTYELWVIDESGPVPAGTFIPDRDGRATVLVEGEVSLDVVVAVTEEPAGGSDAPTGEVLLMADLDA
ncbi:MAG: anti-sigma factor [Actinomycetota bacterium]